MRLFLACFGMAIVGLPIDPSDGGRWCLDCSCRSTSGKKSWLRLPETPVRCGPSVVVRIIFWAKHFWGDPSLPCKETRKVHANRSGHRARSCPMADLANGWLGSMAGQTHHFLKNNSGKAPSAKDRLRTEVARLYRVLDPHLGERD